MEPTLSFTPAPTIRLVMNELRSDGWQDERYEHAALDARLETVLDTLDELHDAASDGRLGTISGLNRTDVLGLLRDLIYTAEQTMAEIEGQGTDHLGQPTLSLVRKPS